MLPGPMMSSPEFSMGGYPLGAQNDPRAPYNQKDPEKVKVKVTVSVTYSKELEVEVEEDYTYKDLQDAVRELNVLPKTILEQHGEVLKDSLEDNTWLTNNYDLLSLKEDIAKHEGWHEDELEVIPYTFPSHAL